MLAVRPILSSLLASKTIDDKEKSAILDYLGGIETLDEDAVSQASQLASDKSSVYEAMQEIFQKHTNRPEPLQPQQLVSEPAAPARLSDAQSIRGVMEQILHPTA